MNSRRLRLWLAIAFFLLAAGVLIWSFLPAPRVQHSLPVPPITLPSSNVPTPAPNPTPQPALLERRKLILEWPAAIREKDSQLIVLTIAMDENGTITPTVRLPGAGDGGTPVEIPNIYDTHTLLAVARLDLAGMEAYRENIREPLLPGKPVTFRWSVRANEPGVYRGVVWLHLEMVPKTGGTVEDMLLLASPIEIQVVTVLGLPGNVARIFGGIGLVASTLLGYPFIQRWIAEQRSKRNQKKPPVPSPEREQPAEEVHRED